MWSREQECAAAVSSHSQTCTPAIKFLTWSFSPHETSLWCIQERRRGVCSLARPQPVALNPRRRSCRRRVASHISASYISLLFVLFLPVFFHFSRFSELQHIPRWSRLQKQNCFNTLRGFKGALCDDFWLFTCINHFYIGGMWVGCSLTWKITPSLLSRASKHAWGQFVVKLEKMESNSS